MSPLAQLARRMFGAAVEAVHPATLMRRVAFLPDGVRFGDLAMEPAGKLGVVAIGKAAGGLAAAFVRSSARPPDFVFVLAPDGAPAPASIARHIRVASHPVPDERGVAASAELLDLFAGLSDADAVVVLLSGGASALLAKPLEGLSLADASALTRALQRAGASIGGLNTVRKHLFAALGGRLAAASPASFLTLALSDVVADALGVIGSGPTVGDETTFADARAVAERYGVRSLAPAACEFLAAGARGAIPESPKPGDARLNRSQTVILGSSRDALDAAALAARDAGLAATIVTRRLTGEARAVGHTLGALAAALAPGEASALLFAGETSVRVSRRGTGGRNLELALAAASTMKGTVERCLLAAGTDGVDGNSPAAGTVVDGGTLARASRHGRDAAAAFAANDSWAFFDGLPEAIITGPTGTNVADVVFILVAGGARAAATLSQAAVLRAPVSAGGLRKR